MTWKQAEKIFESPYVSISDVKEGWQEIFEIGTKCRIIYATPHEVAAIANEGWSCSKYYLIKLCYEETDKCNWKVTPLSKEECMIEML